MVTVVKTFLVSTKSMVRAMDKDGNDVPDYCGTLSDIGPKVRDDFGISLTWGKYDVPPPVPVFVEPPPPVVVSDPPPVSTETLAELLAAWEAFRIGKK